MTNKYCTTDGNCVNFLNGECDHMNGCYVKWLDDNYDYIKNFDTLYYRLLSKAKEETKTKCKLFTIFVSTNEISDNKFEFKYNEKILFNYITEKFNKSFNFVMKSKINRIVKKETNTFVNNLFNKVKYNIIDYTTGDVIMDLIDTIINSSVKKNRCVDNIINSLYVKLADKFYSNLFKSDKDIRIDIKVEGEAEAFLKDNSISIKTQLYKYTKRLVEYHILNYIGFEIVKLFKKSKKFKYINDDLKMFFNRSAFAIEDQKNDFDEFLSTNRVKVSKSDRFRNIIIKSSNCITDCLNEIIANYDKLYVHSKKYVNTTNFIEIENMISKKFDEHFGFLSDILNTFNNLNSTINKYKKNFILQPERANELYVNAKRLFIDDFKKLIDMCIEFPRNLKDVYNYDPSDFIYYIRAIKKSFRASTMLKYMNSVMLTDTKFDGDKFRSGIEYDFKQSRSFMRYISRHNLDDNQNPSIIYDFITWVDLNIEAITDVFTKKISGLMDLITSLDKDMDKLMHKYLHTDAYNIARLYVSPFNIPVLVDGGYLTNTKIINPNKSNNSLFSLDISPYIKTDAKRINFIEY